MCIGVCNMYVVTIYTLSIITIINYRWNILEILEDFNLVVRHRHNIII